MNIHEVGKVEVVDLTEALLATQQTCLAEGWRGGLFPLRRMEGGMNTESKQSMERTQPLMQRVMQEEAAEAKRFQDKLVEQALQELSRTNSYYGRNTGIPQTRRGNVSLL